MEPRNTLKVLETYILKKEIIGVSALYAKPADSYGFNFRYEFDIYTKQNAIKIHTNHFNQDSKEEKQQKWDEVKEAHKTVLEFIEQKESLGY